MPETQRAVFGCRSTRAIWAHPVVVQDTRTDIGLPTESARLRAFRPSSCPCDPRSPAACRLAAPCGSRDAEPSPGLRPGARLLGARARSLCSEPTFSPMAKKDHQLTVRVTADEKREIERRAEAAELSVSRFLAKSALEDGKLLAGAERMAVTEKLRELYREIRSIGGNINQLARHLNQGGEASEEAINRASAAAEQAADAIIDKIEGLK